MHADHSALSRYRSDVSIFRSLTAEKERELVSRWRSGDKRAGEAIVHACLPFVMTIALEYRRWGLPMEDIIQEGNIGLLKAADRFDEARGCRLVTYAAYWIRAEIRDYVVRAYRIVRLGSSKSERRALRFFRKTSERDPQILAENSGLTKERAERLLPLLSARDVNIDAPDASGLAPSDRIANVAASPEQEAAESEERLKLSAALHEAIATLTPREQDIVHKRYLDPNPMTLEQVGNVFGISKERVRQIEERAKRRMREKIELKMTPHAA